MMERDREGTWKWAVDLPNTMNPDYARALPCYMTAYDKLFGAAKSRSEFDFVLALVHHQFDSHFDPFETTKRTYRAISDLHKEVKGYETEVSIALWLYGHIVEASYPYQMIGDMLGIAAGAHHRNPIFPLDDEGRELSPGRKIEEMENRAKTLGLKSSIAPLRRSWHPDLRNAIFHSNYAIVGDKLRLLAIHKTLPIPAILTRINRRDCPKSRARRRAVRLGTNAEQGCVALRTLRMKFAMSFLIFDERSIVYYAARE